MHQVLKNATVVAGVVLLTLAATPTHAAPPELPGKNYATPQQATLDAPPGREGWYLVGGRWAKPVGKLELSDLLTLHRDRRTLVLTAHLSEDARNLLAEERAALLEINRTGGAYIVTTRGRRWVNDRTSVTDRLRLRWAGAYLPVHGSLVPVSVDVSEDTVTLDTAGTVAGRPVTVSVVLNRNEGSVQLSVIDQSETHQGRRLLYISRPSLPQMLQAYPDQTRTYLVPALACFSGGENLLTPGRADLQRAFPELPIDPRATARLKALLSDLADRRPQVRHAAREALFADGEFLVPAAMALNMADLSPTVRSSIQSLIDAHTFWPDSTGEQLRANPGFLADCRATPSIQQTLLASQR